MEVLFLPSENLTRFLTALSGAGRLLVPVSAGEDQYRFKDFKDVGPENVALEYLRTMVPPKKFFFPPEEELFTFTAEEGFQESEYDDPSLILFGLHPCDLHGIKVIDIFFNQPFQDSFYNRRRRNSRLIGLGCMPDDKCFCQSTGTEHIDSLYDIFLWQTQQGLLTLIRSPEGHEFIHLDRELFKHPTREQITDYQQRLDKRRSSFTRGMPVSDLPQLLEFETQNQAWGELGDACFACGACNMVCPTCTCFNVYDRTDLSGAKGSRVRRWDSCLFRDFTRIAGDHQMRPDRADRVKNRYYHKEQGFIEQFGSPSCVGCGRCIDACIAGINITNVFAQVRANCGA